MPISSDHLPFIICGLFQIMTHLLSREAMGTILTPELQIALQPHFFDFRRTWVENWLLLLNYILISFN